MPKEQVQAIKKKIRNPEISLNEKVMDGIKELKLDEELQVTATLKVMEVSKETDYDFDMCEPDYKLGKERPKVLRARFEVMNIKKAK